MLRTILFNVTAGGRGCKLKAVFAKLASNRSAELIALGMGPRFMARLEK